MRAIELKRVSFSYGENGDRVLKNASLTVDYGEVVLLSGCSGEGKSTVLSLIAGIIPNITPGQIMGQVLIDGEDISGRTMGEICRKVGVVLQNAESQIIQQIAEDEIAFGCENFGFPKTEITERIAKSCKQMGLDPTRRTRTLSGGQKQRLITAATLATKQRILVLDEPLANLDKAGAELLMCILRALAQEGYAVLVVEHRLDMVLPYVDTVWSIRRGVVSKVGDQANYLQAQAEYIQDGCRPGIPEENAFEIEHLGFQFQKREILRDITLNIKKGERVLLLGENGCGKTTLMRSIARLSTPSKGTIRQFIAPALGQKIRGSKAWFKRVGVVYQNPNYQLFMPTVAQEIALGAASKEYARDIMELFGLSHLAERHPSPSPRDRNAACPSRRWPPHSRTYFCLMSPRWDRTTRACETWSTF